MFGIPLFPLNTVLFPGAPLQLHIFEERYKDMIGKCIEKEQEFGVVLVQQGIESHGPLAEPYTIGCTARIVHVQQLDQGRMNIVALGKERFRILSLDQDTYPYLVGKVHHFPLVSGPSEEFTRPLGSLRSMLDRFIQGLLEAGGEKLDLYQIPDDPVALAYMAATLLQISPTQKQYLLSLEHISELLLNLQSIYRRELALLRVILSRQDIEPEFPFSKN